MHPKINRKLQAVTLTLAILMFICVIIKINQPITLEKKHNLNEAKRFLKNFDRVAKEFCKVIQTSAFEYETNLTDANKKISIEYQNGQRAFYKKISKEANNFAWEEFQNMSESVYNTFNTLTSYGQNSDFTVEKHSQLTNLISDMENKFGSAKICCYQKTCKECSMHIEPDLTNLMAYSRNYDELLYVWTEWRNLAGGYSSRAPYLKYVALKNEMAVKNGYKNTGDEWGSSEFEMNDFMEVIERIWNDIKPLYVQLHTYVRNKLMIQYPGKILPNGPIPAHILGNMWGQMWKNIFPIVEPYPDRPIDITPILKEKNITVLSMVKMAETFFTSMGLEKMTREFWNKSIFIKPKDREMVCHPTTFFDCENARMKMCASVKMEDFLYMHHEMGHSEYYMLFRNLPYLFQEGVSEAFHEAVGDAIALSAATPGHLKKIGLVENSPNDEKTEINFLLAQALDRLALLPFTYVIGRWRWGMFDGSIDPNQMNTEWWNLRLKYQGICPPVKRTEKDFDPISKYHIASDSIYIHYFFGILLQFQLHKALCDESGHTGPLYTCDIYGNRKAGDLLRSVLSKGSTITLAEAIMILTKGKTNETDSKAFLLYFEPLAQWLKKQNQNSTFIGWKSDDATICPGLGYITNKSNEQKLTLQFLYLFYSVYVILKYLC